MATIAIQALAQTASDVYLQPPAGKKWLILYAFGVLHTGTGTGNRLLTGAVAVNDFSTSIIDAVRVLNTGTQTGTSTYYQAWGGATNQGSGSGVSYYDDVSLTSADRLHIEATLISGDTYDYYVRVDEIIDE